MIRNIISKAHYIGKVRGVILDWSGTTIDPFVIAPAVVFVDVFKSRGVNITMEEARGPMGLRKDLHIKALTETPSVIDKWYNVHNRKPNDEDVKVMFNEFVPKQIEVLKNHTDLLPHVNEVVNKLRNDHNIKIGTTTGFTSKMVDQILKDVKKQGYYPDASVAGDDVINGARPGPFMVYRNLDLMNISPIQSVVKVDDTVSGVGEGLNAGCWTVGIAGYSNYMNINTMDEYNNMSVEEYNKRLEISTKKLVDSGAHYVIDNISYLPSVIDDINKKLEQGEIPMVDGFVL